MFELCQEKIATTLMPQLAVAECLDEIGLRDDRWGCRGGELAARSRAAGVARLVPGQLRLLGVPTPSPSSHSLQRFPWCGAGLCAPPKAKARLFNFT